MLFCSFFLNVQTERDFGVPPRLRLSPHRCGPTLEFGSCPQKTSQFFKVVIVAHDETRLELRRRDGGDEVVEWEIGKGTDDRVEADLYVAEGIASRQIQVLEV